MKIREARQLLGFPPSSHPTPSQVKAAYKKKVWDVHPDRFPADERSYAESKFKMISEAYACLLPDCWCLSRTYDLEVCELCSPACPLEKKCSEYSWWRRKIDLSFTHTGCDDRCSEGVWRWKTSSLCRLALPCHYLWDSRTRRSIRCQGIQKAEGIDSIPQSFSSLT